MDQVSGDPVWRARREAGARVPVTLTDPAGAWVVEAFVVAGPTPGPTLVVLAGVHGDEYEGPVAIARLLGAIDPATLAGTLVAVPVANPAAFAAGTRESPLDGRNLARCFPGDPDGTASERLAHALTTRLLAGADALVDLHSGGVAYEMATLAGYCDRGDDLGPRSRELAVAFGAPVLWRHPEIAPGRTLSAALALGIPCLYTEAAGGGAAPEPIVHLFAEGVRRVMVALEMLSGAPVAPRHRAEWDGSGDTDRAVEARAAGLFRATAATCQEVAAGTLLGEIVGYDGAVREQIISDAAGVVAMLRRVPRVAAGDGLYLLTRQLAAPDQRD